MSPVPPPPPPSPPTLVTWEGEKESESGSDYSSESESSDYEPLPSVKKQKVNEEDGGEESSDFETLDPLPVTDGSCIDGDDEDTYEDGYFKEPGDIECWNKYVDQIKESEGFDIKDCPTSCPLVSIFPLRCYLEFPKNVKLMEDYAAQALKKYNEKNGTTYEVNEILKVNRDGCKDLIFYITLKVKNGEKEYFQVKVVKRLRKPLKFPIVRPRVKGSSDI